MEKVETDQVAQGGRRRLKRGRGPESQGRDGVQGRKGHLRWGRSWSKGHLGTGRLVGKWLQHRVGCSRASGSPPGISDSVGPSLSRHNAFPTNSWGMQVRLAHRLLFEQQE